MVCYRPALGDDRGVVQVLAYIFNWPISRRRLIGVIICRDTPNFDAYVYLVRRPMVVNLLDEVAVYIGFLPTINCLLLIAVGSI